MPDLLRSARVYRIGLVVLVIVAVALRIPALFQDLPPYTFCDEDIYASEAFRMYLSGSWRTTEFRSGPFNTYPVLLIASLLPPLDHLQFLILGRVFYAVVLSSATVMVIAAATRVLFARRDVAFVTALGFVISPTALAISRYWYPDHYLIFFSALLLFWLARLISAPRSWWEYAALGVTWALGLTVKYSFAFAAVAIAIGLLVVWHRHHRGGGWRGFLESVLRGGGIVAGATAVVLVILNVSAFFDPVEFWSDVLFNFQNYGREGASASGIVFYAFLLFCLTIGLVGLVGYVVGGISLVRSSWPTALLLLGFPVVLIAYLGIQGLVISRNMFIAFAFVLPVFGLGTVALLQWALRLHRVGRLAVLSVVVVAFGAQAAVVGVLAVRDLQPDSRVLAEQWISENVPASASIGVNEFCSGPSPAFHLPGVERDPGFEAGLDYYVINSYWDSALNPAYRGRSAIGTTIDQEYLHFYYLNDRGLPFYYVSQFFTPRILPEDVVPDGYRIERIFSSNGPDIIVLGRLDS